MNIPEYNTDIANNFAFNLASIMPKYNESVMPTIDYLYDGTDNNTSYSGGSQHLSIMLQQFFLRMSDNQSTFDLISNPLSQTKTSLSLVSSLPSSSTNENSYRTLSIISFWFVLLINPIVVKMKIVFKEIISIWFFLLSFRFYLVSLVIFLLLTF